MGRPLVVWSEAFFALPSYRTQCSALGFLCSPRLSQHTSSIEFATLAADSYPLKRANRSKLRPTICPAPSPAPIDDGVLLLRFKNKRRNMVTLLWYQRETGHLFQGRTTSLISLATALNSLPTDRASLSFTDNTVMEIVSNLSNDITVPILVNTTESSENWDKLFAEEDGAPCSVLWHDGKMFIVELQSYGHDTAVGPVIEPTQSRESFSPASFSTSSPHCKPSRQ